jgi:hypothetical protein
MWARPYMKINFKFTFSMKDIIIYKGGTGRPPRPPAQNWDLLLEKDWQIEH